MTMRVAVSGRPRGWYDESKARTWPVLDGEMLVLTAAGEWMLRPAGITEEALPIDRDQARALLAAAGLSTAPADQWSPPEPRRAGRPGRRPVGAKVDVRLPDEMLAAVDAIAADDGVTRADVIRAAVADRVELRERGLDERAPSVALSPAAELAVWRHALQIGLRQVAFSVPELCCVADVLNESIVQDGFGAIVAHEVSDAFADAEGPSSYGAKWDVDEGDLLLKLARLGPVADYALRRAVAGFWGDPGADASDPEMWTELGFAVEEEGLS